MNGRTTIATTGSVACIVCPRCTCGETLKRSQLDDDEMSGLRTLLLQRQRGVFISMEEGRKRTDKVIKQRRKKAQKLQKAKKETRPR